MLHRNRLETKHLFPHCGKLAGLAVLNADPLENISNVQGVDQISKGVIVHYYR
ncbi:MAG: hypothetical protein LLG42_04435 [Chloroflexi bacterium]|nr:hypothetical protein [Chloroflexota bacterium]